MRLLTTLLLAALLPGLAHAQARRAPTIPALIVAEEARAPVVLESAAIAIEPAGGMVRTTVSMEFRNPNSEVLEGNLQFPLRPGQQVVGFALDIGGNMREAVAVEKERGRQVFESIEREGVDPGLLEQTQGDYFRLRIYPLPPKGTRRVRIDLMEPLQRRGDGSAVTLPLSFASALETVPLRATSPGGVTVVGALDPLQLGRTSPTEYVGVLQPGNFDPQRGLTLVFADAALPIAQREVHGGVTYFATEVRIPVQSRPRALPSRIAIVWDSSLSGAQRAHDLEFALLDRYFAATRRVDVDLIRLRDVEERSKRFTVRGGDWSALRQELEATVYDGATRGEFTPVTGAREYLLFSDGLFNYGGPSAPVLAAKQRLYAIRAGASGDSARLSALANAHGGRLIQLDDGEQLTSAADALLHDATRVVAVDGVGATDLVWESPFPLDGFVRVAGKTREATPRLTLRLSGPEGHSKVETVLSSTAAGRMAARLWARYRIAELQSAPELNRAAITRLGAEFSIVGPHTSLIVLERPEDYARHGIAAPPELQAQVASVTRAAQASKAKETSERLDRVAAQWSERITWWEKPFPKDKRSQVPAAVADGAPSPPAAAVGNVAPAPRGVRNAPAQAGTSELDRVSVTGSRIRQVDAEGASPVMSLQEESADEEGSTAAIRLQPWQPDSPVARRLRTASADETYRLYLDERTRASQGTAFYLDVADILFEKQQPALALRVLSNLAEMELEDRHILRVLAYRLMQANRPDLAIPVLERVLAIGGEEPQSYRDLGLAYAANGERQTAVDHLYEVVARPWDGRFPDIEVISLAELNALVATSPTPIDTTRIDPRFKRNLPVGLRAVLSWDSDNSDMDLHVTDPNGEEAFYSHPLTYQGGRMSRDFTGGYGPEEFVLRNPVPGKYKVQVVYFGDRQQIVTGATTLQVWLSTGFGTALQQDQKVTVRLTEKRDEIFVGEFEVR